MGRKRDLTGQRFGRLVVVEDTNQFKYKQNSRIWKCLCDCGNEVLLPEINFIYKSSGTKSCGCIRIGRAIELGKNKTPEERERVSQMGKNKTPEERSALGKNKTPEERERVSQMGKNKTPEERSALGKKLADFMSENDFKEGTSLSGIQRKIPKTNKSGTKGVHLVKKTNKWKATISFKGEMIHLGCFSNKQDAINARKEAEEKYFKPILEKYGKTQ